MNKKLYFCHNYTLNVQVFEAKDIPSMDKNGKSDPFLRLYLLGPKPDDKIEKVQTQTIKKTLDPVWNEEYHFPIKSLGTDVLHMSLKNYNSIGKDDQISKYDLQVRDLILGKVYDDWLSFIPDKGIKKGGLIHLKYQLAPPQTFAYKDVPKETKSFHIQVIEAKEVKSKDLNGFADPFCQMQIIGDRTFSKTSIKNQTLSPYWDETFHFIITNYETDIFKLDLMDKDKFSQNMIGSINFQINQFELGKVYKKWVEVQNKGKKTGLIRVMININITGEEPFLGEIIEEKQNFNPSDKWNVNIHLIKAHNLPSVDSNGLSDPYCIFSILNTKYSVKSRRIDKCLNPIWDEYFEIPINSLNSDILLLEIIDWNQVLKHEKLCMREFPLIKFEFGKVYSEKYSLIPLDKKSGGSTVELTLQITPPFVIPFTESLYIPDQLNIKLKGISGITAKKNLKNPKLYFNLKLEKDSNDGIRSRIKKELNTELREEFNFIITDQSIDKLIIEYKNETNKNKTISKCIIPLNDLQQGISKEIKNSMDPSGLIHLLLTIDKKKVEAFEDKSNILSYNSNNIISEKNSKEISLDDSKKEEEAIDYSKKEEAIDNSKKEEEVIDDYKKEEETINDSKKVISVNNSEKEEPFKIHEKDLPIDDSKKEIPSEDYEKEKEIFIDKPRDDNTDNKETLIEHIIFKGDEKKDEGKGENNLITIDNIITEKIESTITNENINLYEQKKIKQSGENDNNNKEETNKNEFIDNESKPEKKENEKLISLNDIIDSKNNIEIKEENINLIKQNVNQNEEKVEDNFKLDENKIFEKNIIENEKEENENKNVIKEANKELIEKNIIDKIEKTQENQFISLEEDIIKYKNDLKSEEENISSIKQNELKIEDQKDNLIDIKINKEEVNTINDSNKIEEEKEKIIEKLNRNKESNRVATNDVNELTNDYIKTNKNNEIQMIKKNNSNNNGTNITNTQFGDVKIMINSPILDDNFCEKDILDNPFDILKEKQCCPDCNIV